MQDPRPVVCYVDSNILLHFSNLDSIPWPQLLKAREVVLVIAPVTFDELNHFKDGWRDPHLHDRALSAA